MDVNNIFTEFNVAIFEFKCEKTRKRIKCVLFARTLATSRSDLASIYTSIPVSKDRDICVLTLEAGTGLPSRFELRRRRAISRTHQK